MLILLALLIIAGLMLLWMKHLWNDKKIIIGQFLRYMAKAVVPELILDKGSLFFLR